MPAYPDTSIALRSLQAARSTGRVSTSPTESDEIQEREVRLRGMRLDMLAERMAGDPKPKRPKRKPRKYSSPAERDRRLAQIKKQVRAGVQPIPRPIPKPIVRNDRNVVRAIALHEAGHALGFLLGGYGVGQVRLVYNGGHLTGGQATRRLRGDPMPWVFLCADAAVTVFGMNEHLRGFNSDSDSDRKSARAAHVSAVAGYDQSEWTIRRHAESIVRKHYDAVDALARELARTGHVRGRDAERILLERLSQNVRTKILCDEPRLRAVLN